MMPTIFIVDDEEKWQNQWTEALKDKVNVVSAFTIEEAEEVAIRLSNANVALIVMDANVPPGEGITTEDLVYELREIHGFKCPMIAASVSETYRGMLMDAGCDHECEKKDVPKKVLEILKLE